MSTFHIILTIFAMVSIPIIAAVYIEWSFRKALRRLKNEIHSGKYPDDE